MKKILLFLVSLLTMVIQAQNPGDIAQTFGQRPGFDGDVHTIATQTNGKILVGGFFRSHEASTAERIIRLNADGTKDTSFNTEVGFNDGVYTIATQTDGKILVGGQFTNYNGSTANRIIRLNADSTKDTSFNFGTGFNGNVLTIVPQADGKILVGGQFTSYNGSTENYIIRLNADGTKDNSFNTGTGFGGYVYTIATQVDGKILVGGYFSTYNGSTVNRIIRLNADGTKDNSFNSGTGFNNNVLTIATQTDGKILVGGGFQTYNGSTANRIIRLNTDGTQDTSFNTGTGFSSHVYTIVQQADDKILVGGNFISYKGSTENYIIRLNVDGTKDNSFNSGTGFNDDVYTIVPQVGDKILVGGSFPTYKGSVESNITRLNADGAKDNSFNTGTGFSSYVHTIVPQADGKILVGGSISTYNKNIEHGIIRLNADGTKDTSFNTATEPTGPVNTIATQADGKILVGGQFTSYNGSTANRITRLNADGTQDNSFNTGTGFNNLVYTIVPQADGKILVGGQFTSYNGITANRIIRLNADGTKDTSFNTGTGFSSYVYTIVTQVDGKILVGGYFLTYNGSIVNRIIRLNADGTKDTSFNTGTGFNNNVLTIATQADGKILVGGFSSNYNGSTSNSIIRLNANGIQDTSFNPLWLGAYVYTIVPQADGKILVGGQFTNYNGSTGNRIIRLNTDGTKDTNFNTGTGFNNDVYTIATLANGKILVGGQFTNYNGNNESDFIIGLHSETSLSTTDFNNSNPFIIYPNPVQDVLQLQTHNFTNIKTVKIIDLQGKLILEEENNTINVSTLSKGVYIIKVITKEGEFTKKFIKE